VINLLKNYIVADSGSDLNANTRNSDDSNRESVVSSDNSTGKKHLISRKDHPFEIHTLEPMSRKDKLCFSNSDDWILQFLNHSGMRIIL
jgi:hypothetical protein